LMCFGRVNKWPKAERHGGWSPLVMKDVGTMAFLVYHSCGFGIRRR
jgi:hypothetical protein